MSTQLSGHPPGPQPRDFDDSSEWMRGITRTWQFLPPVDMRAAITPDEVEAASGHTFVITLTAGPGLVLARRRPYHRGNPGLLGLPFGQLLPPGCKYAR